MMLRACSACPVSRLRAPTIAPPVEANLVNYLWPLLVVLLTPVLLPGWRLTLRHGVAALAGFAGAALAIGAAPSALDPRSLAGFALGLLLAKNLDAIRNAINSAFNANLFPAEFYFLSRLPAIVDAREVAVIVGMTLIIAILASIYPAWKAASLDPIDALRHE